MPLPAVAQPLAPSSSAISVMLSSTSLPPFGPIVRASASSAGSASQRRVGWAAVGQAAGDRVGQVLGCVGVEAEAVAVVAFAHGVVQATGGAHDRDRAVAQGDLLAQAAWFIARWHQEGIAAGVDSLRQRRVEAHLDIDARRI